ncbi:MAG: DNA-3-methyladenine glycosylase [Acidobacteriia bacterium]|nr:DNA-3-methyladenine glycosylase [Terriglobia bacterium]
MFVMDGLEIKKSEIFEGPRVGIKKANDKMWNFKITKNVFDKN